MGRLSIYELDSDKEPVSTLETGEYIFGRGTLLKCDDRRVSRKHGVIKITEKAATITSTHQNPCFYQAANSSTITILPKDKPVDVGDGDKFALLADQFWFKIKFQNYISDIYENGDTNSSCIRENGNHLPVSALAGPSKAGELTQIEPNESKCVDNDTNLESMVLLQSNYKRTHEDDVLASEVKKARYDEDEDQLSEPEEDTSNKEVDNKKDQVSESEDDTNETVTTSAAKKKPRNSKKSSANQNDHDAELQAMLFSSDEDIEKEDKTEENSHQNDASTESSKKAKNSESDDGTTEKNVAPNVASTSSTKKKERRDHCWYGLSCYRKNPAHLAEYSHPGDSDYESDPEDDRPMCSFGAACYRRNKNHRQAYKHPSKPQKPTGKSKPSNYICIFCNCQFNANHFFNHKPGYEP
ncbi:hypothetical protein ILUMI_05492 [Ignelater luminosus]|uniref:PBZ-type domain-containing protein n=1 Tax=Ignelater luminosus TaxID=2038154 RepID=A0A8K0GI25_IGNLU|nr:hypothetical protein ILUMI_05492 [Ignelater luminosus]